MRASSRQTRTSTFDAVSSYVLRATLGAGVTRCVLALNRSRHRAVPTVDDAARSKLLAEACALDDVSLVDIVILRDDGFCSLLRLGMLAAGCADGRYR